MGEAQEADRGTPLITQRQRAEWFERELMKIATTPGPPLTAEQVRAFLGSPVGCVTIPTREDVARERRDREASLAESARASMATEVTGTPKERILAAMNDLPADITFEAAIERLVFLAQIDEGLAQLDAGRSILHEELTRRFGA